MGPTARVTLIIFGGVLLFCKIVVLTDGPPFWPLALVDLIAGTICALVLFVFVRYTEPGQREQLIGTPNSAADPNRGHLFDNSGHGREPSESGVNVFFGNSGPFCSQFLVSTGTKMPDITHSFAASAVYELPRFSNMNVLARSVIGGWQLSSVFTAASGQALLLSQTSSISPSRPDYIGGDAITGNYTDTLQYLAPAVFARVPLNSVTGGTIRPGNVGNGAIRGPGRWNDDLSLGKNFHLFIALSYWLLV